MVSLYWRQTRRKVVCAPGGVPDQERGMLVCNEVRSPAPWRAGERNNVDALLCKDALQGVPHAQHRLAMPVLGARHQQAEQHVRELRLDQRLIWQKTRNTRTAAAMSGILRFQVSSSLARRTWLETRTTAYPAS